MRDPQSLYRLPPITPLMLIAEFGIILIGFIIATNHLWDMSTDLQFSGGDTWLVTNSVTFSAAVYRQTGALPLWNPFVGDGEPSLESFQSFVLNPFMSGPFMWFGTINGFKIGVLLHVLIMAVGGWVWARVMQVQPPGRVLAALLLMGAGSMTGPLGRGLYQLGLSQTYVPWVMAGLVVCVYRRQRWGVALLAIAGTLLALAGTFWYVLPTMIAVAVYLAFNLPWWDKARRTLFVDMVGLRRVALATLFALGLVAVRLLSLNRDLLYHPGTSEYVMFGLHEVLANYVIPFARINHLNDAWRDFHFAVPLLFLVLLIGLRAAYTSRGVPLFRGYRPVIAVAALNILLFSVWAQGETPLLQAVYERIPFLQDWRNPGRMAAAATPWIILVTVLLFDEIYRLLRRFQNGNMPEAGRWNQFRRLPVARSGALALLLAGSLIAGLDVLYNWRRTTGLWTLTWAEINEGERIGLEFLQARYPAQLRMVQSRSYVTHPFFVTTLTRYTFGDADVYTVGKPPTIGRQYLIRQPPTLAAGSDGAFVNHVTATGYEPLPDSPPLGDQPHTAWINPRNLPYAFVAPETRLGNDIPMTSDEVRSVTYLHRINEVELQIDFSRADEVAIVAETSYPGWVVTIDGVEQAVESVGGRLAVRLPESAAPIKVVFSYRPAGVYRGALIQALTVAILIGYLLRVRVHIPEPLQARFREAMRRAGKALNNPTLLTAPEDLEAAQADDLPSEGNAEKTEGV